MSDIASNLRVSLELCMKLLRVKKTVISTQIESTNIAKQALGSLKNMESSVDKLRTFTKLETRQQVQGYRNMKI